MHHPPTLLDQACLKQTRIPSNNNQHKNANPASANALVSFHLKIGKFNQSLRISMNQSRWILIMTLRKLRYCIEKISKCSIRRWLMQKWMGTPIIAKLILATRMGIFTPLQVWEGMRKSCTGKSRMGKKIDFGLYKQKLLSSRRLICSMLISSYGHVGIRPTIFHYLISKINKEGTKS